MKHIERLFKESILSFCIGIKNILYTSLVPFLVRVIFERILLVDSKKTHGNADGAGVTLEMSDDSDDDFVFN